MKTVLVAAVCAAALSACIHFGPAPTGPEGVARAYAEALEQNRLDAALALSTGLDAQRFRELYAAAPVREARVAAVRAAADGAQGGALKLVLENGAWRVQELEPAKPQVQQEAASVLAEFLDAADAGRFEAALA
ncbi:MAG: hypothetical protein JNK82_23005, partial [Myxococcaceae bacterium]|nr:hypothetical protein [Myxococcaceae bacterium]